MHLTYEEHAMYTGLDNRSVPFLKCRCGGEIWQGKNRPVKLSARELLSEHLVTVQSENRHDYEPGDEGSPMQTDPLCRVCGEPKSQH